MRTFNDYVKDFLASNSTTNGTLAGRIVENIQWAWDNWDFDFTEYSNLDVKPERYTDEFADEWISNEPFNFEIEQYVEQYGNDLDYFLVEKFLKSK